MSHPRTTTSTLPWAALGLGSSLVALVVAYAVDMSFTLRQPILSVVASMASGAVPGHAHEVAVKYLGLHDRDLFLTLLVVAGAGICAWAGALSVRHRWAPTVAFSALAGIASVAVLTQPTGSPAQLVTVAVGWLVAHLVFWGMGWLLRRHEAEVGAPESSPAQVTSTRRTLLAAAGAITLVTAAGGLTARRIGSTRRTTASARDLVRLPTLTRGEVPLGAQSAVEGAARWRTANRDFFVRTSELQVPAVDPDDWTLRVHGLVEQPLTLTYEDLVNLPVTEQWTTLTCGKDVETDARAGNAWWSGVRAADVLNWAGVAAGADHVVQRSQDGWECRTPVDALLDPAALLVLGMNGEVLPTEHGFPVRTLVPGLVGDSSACKWLVELEVVRAEAGAGESAEEPDDRAGTQEVPWTLRVDHVQTGAEDARLEPVRVVGTVWGPDSARAGVEIRADGAMWLPLDLLPLRPAEAEELQPSVWRQFVHSLNLPPGDHTIELRLVETPDVEPISVEVTVPQGLQG